MAQSLVAITQDLGSNDNSISTKEFLQFEKTCEAYKDDDEEIKMIFNEIKKLSAINKPDNVISEDIDDVDFILKRAEDIAQETETLLKNSPKSTAKSICSPNRSEFNGIPQIKVTKPCETEKDVSEHKENNTKYAIHNVTFYILLSCLAKTLTPAMFSLATGSI
ncbi:hypothetical protein HF086_012416 [Spodoptera exigua]|uniref:Uncharacterized protein n=1 Tax=Spodoptera exigua TaxID=7107 RepID=A0A922M5S1_SPOEX|nr:hypothetical protein HF086_012416 [Spodoptera exigua]